MRPVSNPAHRFESQYVEWLEEPPPAKLQVYEETTTKEIVAENDSPDVGFRHSVNPYRGCSHACAYCMAGDTPILMADGRSRPLEDLRIGDEIVGTRVEGKSRRYVATRVLDAWSVLKPAWRVELEDGRRLVTSGDHRFLSRRGWKYVDASRSTGQRPHLTMNDLLLGTGAAFVHGPPDTAQYRAGWLCGMIRGDGLIGRYEYAARRAGGSARHQFRLALIEHEGLARAAEYLRREEVATSSFTFQRAVGRRQEVAAIRTSARDSVNRIRALTPWPRRPGDDWWKGYLAGIFDAEGSHDGVVRISNSDAEIIARIEIGLARFGFRYCVEKPPRGPGLRPIKVVRLLGGLSERLRFLQLVEPAIKRKSRITGAVKGTSARVAGVTRLGVTMRLHDITTGTGDFIANGVVSHNCYARPSHEYLGFGAGTDFETRIVVKPRAPELLRAKLRSKSWRFEKIAFSGDTDCYQPLEGSYGLTRACLEECRDVANPVTLVTKSFLIRRDAELLAEMSKRAAVNVSFSIAFDDDDLARGVEPGAPRPSKRFEAMRILSDAGVNCGVLVAPLIPGLNEQEIPAVLERAKAAGARYAHPILLRLPHSVKEVFLTRMAAAFPDRVKRIEARIREVRGGGLTDPRFHDRFKGTGVYWEAIESLFRVHAARVGFGTEPKCTKETAPVREGRAFEQLGLF